MADTAVAAAPALCPAPEDGPDAEAAASAHSLRGRKMLVKKAERKRNSRCHKGNKREVQEP
eukprot:6182824-Pleurochrysis_carterae.AAC.2